MPKNAIKYQKYQAISKNDGKLWKILKNDEKPRKMMENDENCLEKFAKSR